MKKETIKLSEDLVKVLELLGVREDEIVETTNDIKIGDWHETNVNQIDSDDTTDLEEVGVLKEILESIKNKVRENMIRIISEEFYTTYME